MLTELDEDLPLIQDDCCASCGRSVIGRFGEEAFSKCQSCSDEFWLLLRAGKLEV